VITHDFISLLFSLLTDEHLMKPENLIFDDWQKPAASNTHIPMNVFGELNSGSAYKDFVSNLEDPDNTIVIPIIIFGDGTVVDGALQNPWNHFPLLWVSSNSTSREKSWIYKTQSLFFVFASRNSGW